MTYNSNDLARRLNEAFTSRYPGFRCMRFIFSGEPGSGKSTVIASVPIPDGKVRLVMDNEDSMAYLDAGAQGADVYTPRRQQFAMVRKVFPTLAEYADIYKAIGEKAGKVGVFAIDNLAIFQDAIVTFMALGDPGAIRPMFQRFDAEGALPNNGLISTWARQHDGMFWSCAKAIPKAIMMHCLRHAVSFVGTTEEGNVWENYGKPGAKIVGKKAKIWDVWYRYTDAIISLAREVNTTKPPMGQLYPNQPKMRLQGMNPRFRMDWEGLLIEIEAAAKRTEADIPPDAQVSIKETFEDAEPSV